MLKEKPTISILPSSDPGPRNSFATAAPNATPRNFFVRGVRLAMAFGFELRLRCGIVDDALRWRRSVRVRWASRGGGFRWRKWAVNGGEAVAFAPALLVRVVFQ